MTYAIRAGIERAEHHDCSKDGGRIKENVGRRVSVGRGGFRRAKLM